LLARALGEYTKIPVYEDFIVRICDTKPQKLLNPEERLNNLKKAFILKKNGVKLKVVVIIDDIYTTGSTVDEMAKVLLNGGVQQVYFLALAIGETI
ncbi:MAG: ComF family protein, partial [Roseburia sp.]|nr:ComF family protein [Roseburia sp.]